MARILSPATTVERRHAIATEAGVTHVLVNESFPATIPTLGFPVSPEDLSALRESLDRDSTRFHLADRSGALSLYEIVAAPSSAGEASAPPDILPEIGSRSRMRAMCAGESGTL